MLRSESLMRPLEDGIGKGVDAPECRDYPMLLAGLDFVSEEVGAADEALEDEELINWKKKLESRPNVVYEDSDMVVHSPRQYQLDLFEQAKAKNVIAIMDTGTGKTLIACLLVKYVIELDFIKRQEAPELHHKRLAFFLVPTVALVFQQSSYLKYQISGNVKALCGSNMPDDSPKAVWEKLIQDVDIIVATPYILLNALNRGLIKMSQINLIVFDEAHNATGKQPYNLIMQDHYEVAKLKDRPKILGLTASPVNADRKARDAILELEANLHCEAITIMNDEDTSRHSARTRTRLLEYPPTDHSVHDSALYRKLRELSLQLQPLKDVYVSLFLLAFPNILTMSKRRLEFGSHIMTNLGPACAERAMWEGVHAVQKSDDKDSIIVSSNMGLKSLSQVNEPDDDNEGGGHRDEGRAQNNLRRAIVDICKPYYKPLPITLDHVTPKVLSLVKLLSEYENDKDFKGIIFVQRRATAMMLADLLKQVPHLSSFCNVKPVTGHGPGTSHAGGARSGGNFTALDEFRKGIVNLLIATKVAEEGIHISSCKLVVRFDMEKGCMNLVNFIQSRGRARAKGSRFVLMCEEGREEHNNLAYDLKRRERESRRELLELYGRPPVEETEPEEFVPDSDSPLYEYHVPSTGAKATLNSSLSLLYDYCSILPRDPFSTTSSVVTFQASNEGFIATLSIPHPAPQQLRAISGFAMPTKQQAKQVTALYAIKTLHELGHFDDYLIPIRDDSWIRKRGTAQDELFEELNKELLEMRSKKRKRLHKIKIPQLLLDRWLPDGQEEDATIKCSLGVIFLKSISGANTPKVLPFGILTRHPIPSAPVELVLYPEIGALPATIINNSELVEVDAKRLDMAKVYTAAALSPYLKHGLDMRTKLAYFVLPIAPKKGVSDIYQVDWDMARFVAEYDPRQHRDKLYSSEVENHIVVSHGNYDRKYSVKKFHSDLRADMPIPAKYLPSNAEEGNNKTTLDFYKGKLRSKFKPNQPVLQGKMVPRKLNMLSDNIVLKAQDDEAGAKMDVDTWLVPQDCDIYALDLQTIRYASMLPSMLYYLELWYRADELRQRKQLPCDLQMLMAAITTPSAGQSFNYERFETLGDAFLKCALTLHLFVSYPNRHEGILSMMMSKLQSNHELFIKGSGFSLGGYIVGKMLTRTTWKPLTVTALEELTPEVLKEATLKPMEEIDKHLQMLGDKQVADSFEAMLGACMRSGGVPAAAKALQSLYDSAIEADWTEYIKHVRIGWEDDTVRLPEREAAVYKIEELLNYKFKKHCLAIEALTHPSSQDKSVQCYQRLEFLGDAVLGLLAVRFFFYRYPNIMPDKLADLKDASVNNAFLSNLSTFAGLHALLHHFSSPLQDAIALYCRAIYIAKRRDDRKRENVLKAKISGEESSTPMKKHQLPGLYWEDVEAPKCLSDIYEALLGAVFVDSGFDVEAVWQCMQHTWLPWVTKYISEESVGKHPLREMAGKLRSIGCNSWRVPTNAKVETGEFTARIIFHEEEICMAEGSSRKEARRVAAEECLRMIEKDLDSFKKKCTCKGVMFEEKVFGGDSEKLPNGVHSITGFFSRNRRRFAIAAGAAGATYALYKFAVYKWKEMEAKMELERAAKANIKLRFEQNQKDCVFTVQRLLPTLVLQLHPALDVEAITTALQQAKVAPSNDPPEVQKKRKLELWQELKILAFTRTLSAVYLVTITTLFTHIQLNLLGRFIYLDSVAGASARSNGKDVSDNTRKGLSFETERKYLTFSWFLLNVGWKGLVSRVRKAVEDTVSTTPLAQSTNFESMKKLLERIREKVEYVDGDTSKDAFTFHEYLLPPEGEEAKVLREGGAEDEPGVASNDARFVVDDQLKQLLDETRDFMDCPDFVKVLKGCLNQSFELLESQIRPIFFPEEALALSDPQGAKITEVDPADEQPWLRSLKSATKASTLKNSAVSLATWGVVAGATALFFLEPTPIARSDILQHIPVAGAYWKEKLEARERAD
ncbi:Dicer-like protein 1 [Chytridiales sp. JEL 0842]|nr:Dicer-like protein 1 [Chytridiales sp. JEL 0842]